MQLSGRKVLILISPFILGLFSVGIAHAESTSSVHVETSGNGSSTVNVQNNTSSSNTTTTTGKTDIVIECNGVKKEYHSDNAENVHLNCDDETSGSAKSQVNINNNSKTTVNNSYTATPNPTIEDAKKKIADEKVKIKQEVKAAQDKVKEQRKDLFEELTQMIRNLFNSFHF